MHSFKRRGILKINDQFLLEVFHPKPFEFELELQPKCLMALENLRLFMSLSCPIHVQSAINLGTLQAMAVN
jgi:hypothetical protein